MRLLGRQLIVSRRRPNHEAAQTAEKGFVPHARAASRRCAATPSTGSSHQAILAIMWNRARAALEEARALGVPTFNSSWFGGGTNASAAVLAPAQVAAIAPLVRVTAAYLFMYYAFCFFQSWSKLYLSASRRPSHPIRHRRDTPSTRLTSAIAQEADSAPERRRQEADAHAAEIRQLWFKQDADAAVVG